MDRFDDWIEFIRQTSPSTLPKTKVSPPPKIAAGAHDVTSMQEWLKATLYAYWHAIYTEEGLTPEEVKGQFDRDAARWVEKFGCFASPDLRALRYYLRRNGAGRPRADPWFDAMSNQRLKRLTEAAWDAGHISAILRLQYGRQPTGYPSATRMAADLHGLDQSEVGDWKNNRRRPKDPWRFI